MRSRSALYVDAGYLVSAAATRLTGSSFRKSVRVDYPRLIEDLIEFVEKRTGLPLLRVYWYDAGRDGQPDTEQEKIASLPRVKLRLGRVGIDGEQKGVDLRIGLDLVGHARSGIIDSIALLSGDDDLTEAVEESQAQGVELLVLAVPTATATPHGVSRHLTRAADGLELISGDMLDARVTAVQAASATAPTPATSTAVLPPTPADLVRHLNPDQASPSQTVSATGAYGAKAPAAPSYHHDPDNVDELVEEVVRSAYSAWTISATTAQKDDLLTGRPSIPRDLDRAMLVDLSNRLGEYTLSERMRVTLRGRFWEFVTS